MRLNNPHLSIQMLIKAFTAYMKVLWKYLEFYDTHNRAFEDFLSALYALTNACLTNQIIEPIILQRYLRAIAYNPWKSSPYYELVFSQTYGYNAESLVSFINSADLLLVQILTLLKHVSQKPTSLYRLCMVPIPVDVANYIGNSNDYMQVHVQHPYTAMSLDSYVPLLELQLKLCTQMGLVHFCENAH